MAELALEGTIPNMTIQGWGVPDEVSAMGIPAPEARAGDVDVIAELAYLRPPSAVLAQMTSRRRSTQRLRWGREAKVAQTKLEPSLNPGDRG
jgi:hypothetical protein